MEIRRSWRELRVMLKQIFPQLTDEDFAHDSETKESMLDRLAEKIQRSRADLDQIFIDLQQY